MSLILPVILTLIILIFSVFNDIYLGYGLTLSLIIFTLIGLKQKRDFKNLLRLYIKESTRALPVITILLSISVLISIWLCCGTIPSIVYYSLKYINPSIFILFCFIIPTLTSSLIGTSLGTCSAVGVPLIIIAKAANLDLSIVGGAIISGAFVGDRCSPLSSSLLLLCNITNVDLFNYIKKLLKTSIIPIILSCLFYLYFSLKNPLKFMNDNLSNQILNQYNISLVLVIPALIIIILCFFKIPVIKSIWISIILALILSLIIQKTPPIDLLKYAVFGYINQSSLSSIIKGGGVLPMLKTCYIIFLSCCLTGYFNGLDFFKKIQDKLLNMDLNYANTFLISLVFSFLVACIGCTQTIAFILPIEVLKKVYKDYDNEDFALEYSNSSIVTSALVPWCVAVLAPTIILGISSYKFIPYAVFLYIVPICHLISCIIKDRCTSLNL